MALSADGNTALIGGPRDNNERRRGVGVHALGLDLDPAGRKAHRQRARAAKAEFGVSVALSADGNTALIGGPGDSERHGRGVGVHALGLDLDPAGRKAHAGSGGERRIGAVRLQRGALRRRQHRADRRPSRQRLDVGAAWVFTRSGSTWTQQGEKLTGGGESGEGEFGSSVALSAEGNTALIGGPADNARRRRGVGVREHRPDRRHQASDRNRPDYGQAERDGQPQRRRSHQCKFEYGTTPSLEKARAYRARLAGVGNQPRRGVGLAQRADREHHLLLQDHRDQFRATTQGAIETFKTLFPAPTVKTEKATEVTQTSATLNATVNPNGGAVTSCKFEYGPKVPYEKSVPCAALPGLGESPGAVSAPVSGLSTNTTYHFRIVATNTSGAAGGTGEGADETLKTTVEAPTVKTGQAGEITQTSAKLNATVNPNGGEVTSCKFEYVTAKHFEFYRVLRSAHRFLLLAPGVRHQPGGRLGDRHRTDREHRPTTSGSQPRTPPARAKAQMKRSRRCPTRPARKPTKTTEITQTTAKLNGFVGPEGAETVVQVRIRNIARLWLQQAVHSPAGVHRRSRRGVRGDQRTERQHHLLLQDRRRKRRRQKRRARHFATLPNAPTVKTEKASEIGQTTAKLNASVNPNGGEVTECKLEYGPSDLLRGKQALQPVAGLGRKPCRGVGVASAG